MKRRAFLWAAVAVPAALVLHAHAKQSPAQKSLQQKKKVHSQSHKKRQPTPVKATLGRPKKKVRGKHIAHMQVYKNPLMTCCEDWVDHLKKNGFTIDVSEVDDPSTFRKQFGMPKQLAACHTALVNGYVIEGHVPAEEIIRLVETKPAVVGLAVPGMPLGAPGLGSHVAQPFNVVLLAKDGRHMLYRHYGA